MNSLDRHFKELLQDRINELFLETQANLAMPGSIEISGNIHEIGVMRGYMRAMREVYDECDEIMKKLTEPLEKKA